MSNIQLTFHGISTILEGQDVGLLLLVDEQSNQQISVICTTEKLKEFRFYLSAKKTPNTLLNVLWNVIRSYEESNFEIVINTLIDGEYKAYLYNSTTLDLYSISAVDGVLLSIIAKIPIFIDEHLMKRQSMPFNKDSKSMALPVNTLSEDMLGEALTKAVDNENYELAAALNQEIERRKKLKNNKG